MITVKLMGGLGNQMFQYAIGRAVSLDRGDTLVLDKSFYDVEHKNVTTRKYELSYFNINPSFKNYRISGKFILFRDALFRTIARHLSMIYPQYVLERTLLYDTSQFEGKNGDIYFDGFWPCEKYFSHHAKEIREDFQFRIPQSSINKRWSDIITDTCSICLHVRRGDYVTNPDAAKCHGSLIGDDGLRYYRDAITYIASRVQNPVFFLFSDDIEWVKNNLSIEYPVYYMDHNGPSEDYEDLRLMTQCKHFIIANSSFSWWGAWLSKSEEKIVICPKKWFKNQELEIDIACDGWVQL